MSTRTRQPTLQAAARVSVASLTVISIAVVAGIVLIPEPPVVAAVEAITTTSAPATTTTLPPTSSLPILPISPGPMATTDPTTTTLPTTTTTAATTSTTRRPTTTTVPPTTTTTVPPTTTTTVPPTTTTTVPATTTTVHPDGILGLITPTGIPVRLKATEGELWLVATPCGRDLWIRGGTPIHQTTVVLDPGHGGSRDIGAVGPNGLAEKTVNLRIAKETQRLLDAQGISNALTRTADYASILSARARFADAVRAEIMVSIHHNAPTPPPSELPGNEVYIQSGSDKSRRLGGLLYQYSMTALSQFDIQWSSTAGAGVMTVVLPSGADAYGILRHPSTPTALLEFGRLSHAPEAELFATDAYVQAAAKSIADAVNAYLFTDEQGSGWVAGRVRTPRAGLSQADCVDPALE